MVEKRDQDYWIGVLKDPQFKKQFLERTTVSSLKKSHNGGGDTKMGGGGGGAILIPLNMR